MLINIGTLKRLTSKEFGEYLPRAIRGDVDAKNAIIEHFIPYALTVLSKTETSALTAEEKFSCGVWGITEAVNKLKRNFPPRRAAAFIIRTLSGCILNELRSRNLRLKKEVNFEVNEEFDLIDLIPDD